MLGLEQLSPEDRKVVVRAACWSVSSRSPFHDRTIYRPDRKTRQLKDALDGCERILHDEFKDYPESGLYMIGAISEAKGKPKAVPPAATAKPEAKPGAKVESKPADQAKPEAKNDPKAKQKPESESEPKPKVELKPAAATSPKPCPCRHCPK